jgi:hypothetical protein
MKRLEFLAVVACLCGCVLTSTVRAGSVTVDYAGTVTASGAVYPVGTAFSGSVTYDPAATPTNMVPNAATTPPLPRLTWSRMLPILTWRLSL